MILTAVVLKAPAVRFVVEVFSHAPPEVVAVVMLMAREPPPTLETLSALVSAGEFCTKEKVKAVGFKLRLGCPAAVTVRATDMVWVDGLALGAVMVIVP